MYERALDVVLFDAGGTLVRLDFEWMAGCLGGLGLAVTVDALRRAEVAGRRAYDTRAAVDDPDAYFGGMLRSAGADAAQVPAIMHRFRARHLAHGLWTRAMEGARATVDALRRQGLTLAVISNSDGRAEQHLIDCGVREGLAFVVDSHLVGCAKPDPAIFRIALERLGAPADRALFVGDILSVDAEGARGAGTHVVILDPFGDYVPAGVPSIRTIAGLPGWVQDNFDLPAGRAGVRSP